jgi:hypothetical protein
MDCTTYVANGNPVNIWSVLNWLQRSAARRVRGEIRALLNASGESLISKQHFSRYQ